MFSVVELKYFGDQRATFKILKPWWDVFTDYLTILMLMVAVFGGTLQISTDKIICVPVPEGFSMATMRWNKSALKGLKLNSFDSGFKTDLDREQYNLMDQYCYDHAIQWYSKYFPYIAIIHTLVFLISSNFWFKFPGTSSKIEHFISILGKCLDSQWTTKALSETVYEDSDLQIPQRTVLSTEPSVSCSLNLQQSSDTALLLGQKESSNDRLCENEAQVSLCKPPYKTFKTVGGGVYGYAAVKILDKKEGEQAKALFEKVKKFRLHTEEGHILYMMYIRQTILRSVQTILVLAYFVTRIPQMKHIVHCVDKIHITGFTEFFCIHGLWRIFRMLSTVYVVVIFIYCITCIYTLYWIFYFKLKEYSFAYVREETGIDDIPDVKNDFAFLLHLIDQYDKLYARKFAVFLSDVSENKLRQINLSYEWTHEKLQQRIVTNEDNKTELHLFMLPGIPNNVYDIYNLEVLKLEFIKDVSISAAISQQTSLQELWVYNCIIKVENRALAFLKDTITILRVRFSNAYEIPQWMYCLKNLRELYLEGNLLIDNKTSIVLQSLCDLERLKFFHLKSNVTKVPAAVIDVAHHLQHLTIHNQGKRFTTLNGLRKMLCLSVLKLYNCDLERIPSAIFSLSNLQELDLKDNNLRTLEELASFQHLRKLTTLKLHHNKITQIPLYIAKASSLEMLYLTKNNITFLPSNLFKLTRLRHLEVGHNNITSIPIEIEQLEDLHYFDIESNKVSELPLELFYCTKLRVLILSHNLLTSIPPKVKNLTQLRQLDLKGNKLQYLPPELAKCQCLKRSQLNVEEDIFNTLPYDIREEFLNRESR
ncbi:volume-regulated anion channel subunit LRRC8C-like isoform X1 [Carcharodon carcharias]|uniref:volume-regulated anion channel subunit LRRC8C-like isoform X1 n=2 Tax=Carcharodon carcharias TaxID=13397 RepID=UPI001B7F3321|nr:volume-regulated anion channel subunit LRRC8C-like isoform X1 [Carcharodon carcharias]XP_041064205.1 volume-regulated anion channel subunit LRRC8C-like isoform X1 [Carcharodon carcharias]